MGGVIFDVLSLFVFVLQNEHDLLKDSLVVSDVLHFSVLANDDQRKLAGKYRLSLSSTNGLCLEFLQELGQFIVRQILYEVRNDGCHRMDAFLLVVGKEFFNILFWIQNLQFNQDLVDLQNGVVVRLNVV